jgi:hypothetical protein
MIRVDEISKAPVPKKEDKRSLNAIKKIHQRRGERAEKFIL